VIAQQIQEIEYTNFKKSIPDDEYHAACSGVWQVMWRYQGEVNQSAGMSNVHQMPDL
jgi:hypothetical protein